MKVLIVGGTRGIGLGLAQYYLAAGETVTVCGRQVDGIEGMSIVCGAEAIEPEVIKLDVTDPAQVRDVIHHVGRRGLDLLVVTAGMYADSKTIAERPEEALMMVGTHLAGLVYVLEQVIPMMKVNRSGQIAVVASIAGLIRPHAKMSLYGQTKRAVIEICKGYRRALLPFGIHLTLIVPGYVDTVRLRQLSGGNAKDRPFLMSVPHAVGRIAEAIASRKDILVFPRRLLWLIKGFNLLPEFVRNWRRR